jgi:tRNA A-37 threonylcarbamoyl transferase component Bud32
VTFAILYTYGHLPAIAFSLSMALACLVVGLRIHGARKDLGLALIYLLTAATTGLELLLVLTPSLAAGRAYLIAGGAVFLAFIVVFHRQYAHDVLPERRRLLYQKGIYVTLGYAALLVVLMFAGALDGGHTRTVELWGVRATLPAMPGWACVMSFVYSIANVVLCAELYHRDGPRRTIRWLVSIGMWAGPLVATWDLTICAGLNPYLPIGGYLCAFVGLEGVVVLVERLRSIRQPETNIAGYRLEKRIGLGGQAEVFLAHRRPHQMDAVVQKVALKRLRHDYADDPHFVRMFLDEARILARLSHPNIVQLLDAGRESGQLFLAMELVDGTTLQHIFRASTARNELLSPEAVLEVGMQLCAALDSAHHLTGEDGRPLELVHRDISPQNVLIDRHGTVKLSDFGIARSADRLTETSTGMVKGKITYMAPEQIRGGSYDQRVDLYSVGVVLFELLTGERLYTSISDAGIMYEILQGRRERLELLDDREPQLGKIVRAALAPEPSSRPASAASMRADLASLWKDARGSEELARWVNVAIDHHKKARGEVVPLQELGATTATRPTVLPRR